MENSNNGAQSSLMESIVWDGVDAFKFLIERGANGFLNAVRSDTARARSLSALDRRHVARRSGHAETCTPNEHETRKNQMIMAAQFSASAPLYTCTARSLAMDLKYVEVPSIHAGSIISCSVIRTTKA